MLTGSSYKHTVHISTHAHARTHTCMYTNIDSHTHMYTDIHRHTHTHTHSYLCSLSVHAAKNKIDFIILVIGTTLPFTKKKKINNEFHHGLPGVTFRTRPYLGGSTLAGSKGNGQCQMNKSWRNNNNNNCLIISAIRTGLWRTVGERGGGGMGDLFI